MKIVGLSMLLLLSGCALLDKNTVQQSWRVVYSNGGCMVFVEADQVKISDELLRDWKFDGCTITLDNSVRAESTDAEDGGKVD